MTTRRPFAALALAAFALAGAGLGAPALPALAPGPAPGTIVAVHVQLAGFSFLPPVVTVPHSGIVVWHYVQAPRGVHTVTAGPIAALGPEPCDDPEDPDCFDVWLEGPLGTPTLEGATFQHQFSAPGTYPYFCSLHYTQGMRGVVVVT